MEINQLLRTKRDEILRLAAKYGAHNVRVFGSVARGEASSASDVDLLVNMEEGCSLLDLTGLWLDLQDLLGCPVDLLTDGGVSPYLNERIYAERSRYDRERRPHLPGSHPRCDPPCSGLCERRQGSFPCRQQDLRCDRAQH